jgi:hypothetical protein
MSHLTMAQLTKLAPGVGFDKIFAEMGIEGLGEDPEALDVVFECKTFDIRHSTSNWV